MRLPWWLSGEYSYLLMQEGEGNGNPLQCSCLENPRDGGAWWAAVYEVAQSQTQLKRLSSSSSNAGNAGDDGSIPGLGKSPGEGNGNPLQYSCLENLMDRGAWQAIVPAVAKKLRMTWWLTTIPHSGTKDACLAHQKARSNAGVCVLWWVIKPH